jgi:hypothetical protein
MNVIWRFYLDPHQLWRWQQLLMSSDVVAASAKGFKEYQDCVENAQVQGYDFQPSKTTQVTARGKVRRKF